MDLFIQNMIIQVSRRFFGVLPLPRDLLSCGFLHILARCPIRPQFIQQTLLTFGSFGQKFNANLWQVSSVGPPRIQILAHWFDCAHYLKLCCFISLRMLMRLAVLPKNGFGFCTEAFLYNMMFRNIFLYKNASVQNPKPFLRSIASRISIRSDIKQQSLR